MTKACVAYGIKVEEPHWVEIQTEGRPSSRNFIGQFDGFMKTQKEKL
jgi:hypothetical protein